MLPDSGFYTARGRRIARLRGKVGLCMVAALSFLAGMTDAVGFTATGDFVSFMSGNTTRLAVSISERDYSAILTISSLIGAFIAGNAIGVIVTRMVGRRSWPLLLCVGALLCLAGLAPIALFSLVCTVIAMGMINAVVEEVNGLPIGLTYVTGALSRFGRGLGRWLMGERKPGWRVQLVPWVGMLLGAVVGALLQGYLGITAFLINGLLAVLLAAASLAIPRRWQRAYVMK
nr:YoaK family protein [uncultured Pseudomonas sp.]